MIRQTNTPKVMADNGCCYAPKCVTCPFRACIKELELTRRLEFIVAWRIVTAHMAPADTVIPV